MPASQDKNGKYIISCLIVKQIIAMKHKIKSTYAEAQSSPGCIWSNISGESSFYTSCEYALSVGQKGLKWGVPKQYSFFGGYRILITHGGIYLNMYTVIISSWYDMSSVPFHNLAIFQTDDIGYYTQ